MATSVCPFDGGWVVIRCSHNPGLVSHAIRPASALGSETNHFIAQADDQGQKSDPCRKLPPEIVDWQESVTNHCNDENHEQETGATSRVPRNKPLRILDGYRLDRIRS